MNSISWAYMRTMVGCGFRELIKLADHMFVYMVEVHIQVCRFVMLVWHVGRQLLISVTGEVKPIRQIPII